MSRPLFPVAILAGGLATRLRPLTETIPKALIDIDGEPFIAHQLRLLHRAGIRRVVLCIGYLGEMIREVIGDGASFGLEIAYSFDGPVLLGTAGSLRRALPLLDGPFFVLYGDAYLDCAYGALQQAFIDGGRPALMAVFHNQGRWDTSNVEYVDGRLITYDKWQRNERMQHIDYGVGIIDPSVIAALHDDGPTDLATVYHALAMTGMLGAYEVWQRFYEIGSHEGIEEFRRKVAAQRREGGATL